MPDASSQRSLASRSLSQPPADSLELEVEVVPRAGGRDAIDGVLRLLATWAVRAARAQADAQVLLDSSAPQSDECTPNRTHGEDVA